MHRFRVLGIVDEPGHCQLCGTYCPARRVAVELVEADGARTGDVQYWGVVCAAEARSGRRDGTIARQLRQEAEEAGAYGGTASSGRRGPRPAVRRQTRREADRLAALASADERAAWFRTSSPVPAGLDAEAAADHRYRETGRQMAGSYYAADDSGRVIRIDGTDPADVDRFARRGFARLETVTA